MARRARPIIFASRNSQVNRIISAAKWPDWRGFLQVLAPGNGRAAFRNLEFSGSEGPEFCKNCHPKIAPGVFVWYLQ